MIVVNKEPRLLILGDGFRHGAVPGKGTALPPGKAVSLDSVPEDQRERFKTCVRRAIAKGRHLEILETAPEGPMEATDFEELRKAKLLADLDRLTGPAVAPVAEPVEAPVEAPKRRGRPPKKPLGG